MDVLIFRVFHFGIVLSGCFCSSIAAQATLPTTPIPKKSFIKENLSVNSAKSACRIFIGNDSGTCFFVKRDRNEKSKKVLITAAHLFEKAKGKAAKLVFRSRSGRTEMTIPIQNSSNVPLWKKHSKYDIAALIVNLPDSEFVNLFSFEQLADRQHFDSQTVTVGQGCRIPCFPAKLESTSLGYPVLRTGSIASYPLAPVITQPTFMVDISAFGGDSGAPVLAVIDDLEKGSEKESVASSQPEAREMLMVIGMVFAKQRQTDKTVTPYEEHIRHTPMGISIVVNSVFIRETIELVR